MKYYIDTEFVEGAQKKSFLGFRYGETKPTIDLISIGVVCEDGRTYYAVSSDFNLEEAWYRVQNTTHSDEPLTYWHRENILLPIYQEYVSGDNRNRIPFTLQGMKQVIKLYGKPNAVIAEEVKSFVYDPYGPTSVLMDENPNIEFYGYYCAYDWVVYCQLFGIMMNLPKFFPYYCKDLFDLLQQKVMKDSRGRFIDRATYTRHTKVSDIAGYPTKPNTAHHALSDAIWNAELHDFITKKL